MLEPADVLAFFCLFGFVFAVAHDAPTEVVRATSRRKTLPPWVFEVVWAALYVCMSLSAYFFWMTRFATTSYYLAFLAFALTILLNRVWVRVYFYYNLYYVAFGVLALIFATGAWYLGSMLMNDHTNYVIVASALMAPYLAWLLVAFGLLSYVGPQEVAPRPTWNLNYGGYKG